MAFLEKIWDQICDFAMQYIIEPICSMGWKDVIDILILTVILYQLYRFTRQRRAGRVLVGLAAVVVCCLVFTVLELKALTYIVRLFAAAAFFCVIVIFQPEIRDALEHLGNLTVLNPGSNTLSRKKIEAVKQTVDEVVDAVEKMSASRTGALIVFEGLTGLGDYLPTGKLMDAKITSSLLQNIFYDGAPLHDGALIVRNLRICAASCVLPSTKSKMDFGTMGTRHRAAVGVTEVSDALVVVVSEQTGVVSVAQDGKLLRNVDGKTLFDILMTYIAGNAYLRIKRANMRKEYLEMLEKVARVDTPAEKKKSAHEETVDREFKKLIGDVDPDADEELDSAMDEVQVSNPPSNLSPERAADSSEDKNR